MQNNSNSDDLNERLPQVNSVHWLAPDDKNIPSTLQVTVRSQQDNAIAPKDRQSNQMQPGDNIVEGFETKAGAPVLGIQWHPEAYNANDFQELQPQQHRKLLQYMAKAGDAYNARQNMLAEFKHKSLSTLLSKKGLFENQSNEANRKVKASSKNDVEQTCIQYKK